MQQAKLVTDYELGVPVRTIADKYGLHRGTISTIVRRAGGEIRGAGLDAEASALASDLYSSGLTLVQVARKLRIGDEVVRRAVLEHGGQIRPRGRRGGGDSR